MILESNAPKDASITKTQKYWGEYSFGIIQGELHLFGVGLDFDLGKLQPIQEPIRYCNHVKLWPKSFCGINI